MEFGLSQEQVLLQDSITRYLKDQVPLDKVRAVAEDPELDQSVWHGLTAVSYTHLRAHET